MYWYIELVSQLLTSYPKIRTTANLVTKIMQ